MKFDISAKLTPQITIIICYHMKKILLKKIYINFIVQINFMFSGQKYIII